MGRNGRMVAFGPDGALYIGRGDEGAGGDPDNRGPNLRDLLCKILRLDVNRNRSEPAIKGRYIYGDDCSREIFWALLQAEAHPRVIEGPQVLLCGQAFESRLWRREAGELYVVAHSEASIAWKRSRYGSRGFESYNFPAIQ